MILNKDNVEALAKKGYLEYKCLDLAPKFHSSTKVQFTTSSPFCQCNVSGWRFMITVWTTLKNPQTIK